MPGENEENFVGGYLRVFSNNGSEFEHEKEMLYELIRCLNVYCNQNKERAYLISNFRVGNSKGMSEIDALLIKSEMCLIIEMKDKYRNEPGIDKLRIEVDMDRQWRILNAPGGIKDLQEGKNPFLQVMDQKFNFYNSLEKHNERLWAETYTDKKGKKRTDYFKGKLKFRNVNGFVLFSKNLESPGFLGPGNCVHYGSYNDLLLYLMKKRKPDFVLSVEELNTFISVLGPKEISEIDLQIILGINIPEINSIKDHVNKKPVDEKQVVRTEPDKPKGSILQSHEYKDFSYYKAIIDCPDVELKNLRKIETYSHRARILKKGDNLVLINKTGYASTFTISDFSHYSSHDEIDIMSFNVIPAQFEFSLDKTHEKYWPYIVESKFFLID